MVIVSAPYSSCLLPALQLLLLLLLDSPSGAAPEPPGAASSSLAASSPSSTLPPGGSSALLAAPAPAGAAQEEEEAAAKKGPAKNGTEPSSSARRSGAPRDRGAPAPPALECGLWLAPSTIPDAGLGMYAGRDYAEGEALQDFGDLAVPLVDLRLHQRLRRRRGRGGASSSSAPASAFAFLWDEYVWGGSGLGMDHHGHEDVQVASLGFGAAANCHLPLRNVEEGSPAWIDSGLRRHRDPGAGAVSPYGNRTAIASRPLREGDEMFVSYGDHWFESREQQFGSAAVPLSKDYGRADDLARAFVRLRRKAAAAAIDGIVREAWDRFVAGSAWSGSSRVLAAFNHSDREEMDVLLAANSSSPQPSLADLRRRGARRDVAWLRARGACGDHLRVGPSALPQAGLGAFARRDLPRGAAVSALPLVHVPDRSVLEMYRWGAGPPAPDPRNGVMGYQILLNYCLGHRDSTVLLCPYGPHASYINHNRTLANARLAWSDPQRSNHDPEALEWPPSLLEKRSSSAALSMDVVATRDIRRGEEVLLDYGGEWEAAWERHAREWRPAEGAGSYRSGHELNSDAGAPVRTEFELLEDPLPNAELWCREAYLDPAWRAHDPDRLDEFEKKSGGGTRRCDVLRRRAGDGGRTLYTALLWKEGGGDGGATVVVGKLADVPRRAMEYYDRPYTIDLFLNNAFRHDIRIPDDMFPEAWKNAAGTG